MNWLGLAVSGTAVVAYFAMLFVIKRFTYRTWIFDALVVLGVAVSALGWLGGEAPVALIGAALLALVWFVVSRVELKLKGSPRLAVALGDPLPEFEVLTTAGERFTHEDLIQNAPAVLEMYRGWWCPTSKLQLSELMRQRQRLRDAGVSIYAASVDTPHEAQPIQDSVGDAVTILCSADGTMLDAMGVRDSRGAPWYDRMIFGAKRRAIAMPAALVIDADGRTLYLHRSTRVDEPVRAQAILDALARRANVTRQAVDPA